jgi:hypothetical protein
VAKKIRIFFYLDPRKSLFWGFYWSGQSGKVAAFLKAAHWLGFIVKGFGFELQIIS